MRRGFMESHAAFYMQRCIPRLWEDAPAVCLQEVCSVFPERENPRNSPEIKMERLLELRHIGKTFRVNHGMLRGSAELVAVDDVSLYLRKGESLGLVGESGCGKSTLGRIACGLLAQSSGERLVQGRPLPQAGSASWAAGKIQMIFQDPASSLNPRMKVGNAVAEPLRARGEWIFRARRKAREMLAAVGLKDAFGRYPHQFSGGQRQRIAVARALVTRPEVIVCDEPVSALDASVQSQILNLLKNMQHRYDPAYLFISHDLSVVGFMCPRIMVMYLGQIVEEGGRDQLFAGPAHPYTQALLAAMPPGAEAWATGQTIDTLPPPLPGELPSPLNPPAGCRFHPRCPRARPVCGEVAPPWHEMGPGWQARCHFPGAGTHVTEL